MSKLDNERENVRFGISWKCPYRGNICPISNKYNMVNPGHNVTGQNATGKNVTDKMPPDKMPHRKMPPGQNATWEVNGRTKCHCLILRESKGDSDENSPEDSWMSPNTGINVHNLAEYRTTEKDRQTDKMVMVLQGHPRSLILATIDNTYATSY